MIRFSRAASLVLTAGQVLAHAPKVNTDIAPVQSLAAMVLGRRHGAAGSGAAQRLASWHGVETLPGGCAATGRCRDLDGPGPDVIDL